MCPNHQTMKPAEVLKVMWAGFLHRNKIPEVTSLPSPLVKMQKCQLRLSVSHQSKGHGRYLRSVVVDT